MRLSLLLIAACVVCAGCADEPVVGDTPLPNAPLGLPDWTDTSYNWISTLDSWCGPLANLTPHVRFQVADLSPDGNRLLLQSFEKLVEYDLATGSTRTIIDAPVASARWSHDGRFIVGRRTTFSVPLPRQQQVFRFSVADGTWRYIPLPDSIGYINQIFHWLPGDTSILILPNFPREKGIWSLSVVEPFGMKSVPAPGLLTTILANSYVSLMRVNRRDFGYERVELRRGLLSDTSLYDAYRLSDVTDVVSSMRTTANADWLAFEGMLDLTNTRLGTGNPSLDRVPAALVLDLRSGSSASSIYRAFVDHTNKWKHCCMEGLETLPPSVSLDGRYLYHEWLRMSDSTMQVARRDIRTGEITLLSNFQSDP